MDNYDTQHKRVKEKSVYLLHLDNARILLISLAVIGLIVASFLLGMNFLKRGDDSRNDMARTNILDDQKELDFLKRTIPTGTDDELTRPDNERIAITGKDPREMDKVNAAKLNNVTIDLLTDESLKEVTPKAKKHENKVVIKETTKKEKSSPSYTKKKTTTKKKATQKKKRRNEKVIEVADSKVNRDKRAGSPNYSIQVASYDTRGRALSEVKKLKGLRYDAHVDRSTVKGREYYRVKIGPLYSKKKAIDLLDNIQSRDRYRNSYMVRE